MATSRAILMLAALTCTPALASAADSPTLCEPLESTYLSCAVGARVLSVCGSKELTATSGYLRYVFGMAGKKPELAYPVARTHPSKAFRRNEPLTSAKAGVMALSFDSSGFTYNVFTTHSAFGYNGAGVLVQKGKEQVALKSCAAGTITDRRFFSDLGRVGIPVGPVRYIGPEQ